jgi:adenosine deaminase
MTSGLMACDTWSYGLPPREIRDKHDKILISKEEYVNIVLRGIREFKQEQQKDSEADTDMSIYLILSIDRGRDTASSAEQVVNIALHHHRTTSPTNPTIVGIELCGNPLKGGVSLFRFAFELAKTGQIGHNNPLRGNYLLKQ